jgi:transcriptional/translational regulatory protein YebC/TACO1
LELRSEPASLDSLRKALEAKGLKPKSVELAMVPKNLVKTDDRSAEQTLRLLDRLEDLDDVQRVTTNADFPDSVLERYQTAA